MVSLVTLLTRLLHALTDVDTRLVAAIGPTVGASFSSSACRHCSQVSYVANGGQLKLRDTIDAAIFLSVKERRGVRAATWNVAHQQPTCRQI